MPYARPRVTVAVGGTRLRSLPATSSLIGMAVAVLLLVAASANAAKHALLDIEGNLVLVDEIYIQVADLHENAKADEATAQLVASRILDFLRSTGYVLATVDAKVVGDYIKVTIDEGRLSKIVLRGKSPAVLLAYRARINLPQDVFNRPELERILASFYPSNNGQYDYELLPAEQKKTEQPQLDLTQILPGRPPLPTGSRYELHIDLTQDPEKASGARLTVAVDNNGYRFGGGYTLASLLSKRDHWDFDAQLGIKTFDNLHQNNRFTQPNRVLARARYYAPPLIGNNIGPLVELREDLIKRQRQDLGVQSYLFNRFDASVSLAYAPRRAEFNLGVGAEVRSLSNVHNVLVEDIAPLQLYDPARITAVQPFSNVLPFVNLAASVTFDDIVIRSDRVHRLQAEGRYYFGSNSSFTTIFADYQKVFELGWNDLWLTASGGIVAGKFSIADAIPMTGHYIRGVYVEKFYMDRALSGAIEYRFSLTRDIIKLAVFNEAVVFRQHVLSGPGAAADVADAFGPGLNALLMDNLQVDTYLSFGFSTARPSGTNTTSLSSLGLKHLQSVTGVSLRISRAF